MKGFKEYITEDKSKPVVFTFGRFNPITYGHEILINSVIKQAQRKKGTPMIFTSHSNDAKKNPLDFNTKVKLLKKFFPKATISTDKNIKTAFQVMQWLSDSGYKDVTFSVGGDRVDEFRKGMTKYVDNGTYKFDKFEVTNAGERDMKGGISGTKMREYVQNNDLEGFKQGLPKVARPADAKKIFNAVKKGMGL